MMSSPRQCLTARRVLSFSSTAKPACSSTAAQGTRSLSSSSSCLSIILSSPFTGAGLPFCHYPSRKPAGPVPHAAKSHGGKGAARREGRPLGRSGRGVASLAAAGSPAAYSQPAKARTKSGTTRQFCRVAVICGSRLNEPTRSGSGNTKGQAIFAKRRSSPRNGWPLIRELRGVAFGQWRRVTGFDKRTGLWVMHNRAEISVAFVFQPGFSPIRAACHDASAREEIPSLR